MSLVFGLCLAKKIYLVSDSRLTYSDGSFKDDFSKWLDLNAHLSVVVANNAYLASWLLQKIKKDVQEDWDFSDLDIYLKKNIKELATQFYSETGRTDYSVGMIFGGFDKTKKLTIDAGRLGQVMSSLVMAAGQGVKVNQSWDSQIRDAFTKTLFDASAKGKQFGKGDVVEIDSPKPRILSVAIKASNSGADITFEDADCYDGLVFNPKYTTERVILPDILISQLEYRERSNETAEETLYQDQRYIISYVYRLLKEKGWPTVGGNVVPLVMLPTFSGFAMGDYVYVPGDGGGPIRGGILPGDGRMHYLDEQGVERPYRFVYDFISEMKG